MRRVGRATVHQRRDDAPSSSLAASSSDGAAVCSESNPLPASGVLHRTPSPARRQPLAGVKSRSSGHLVASGARRGGGSGRRLSPVMGEMTLRSGVAAPIFARSARGFFAEITPPYHPARPPLSPPPATALAFTASPPHSLITPADTGPDARRTSNGRASCLLPLRNPSPRGNS